MKRIVALGVLMMVVVGAFGQKQGNIWYFGNQAGLDFNSGSPIYISGQTYPYTNVGCPNSLCHSEGTAVMSDSSGSLLFYTNGQKIWNRNHQVMPNGDSLLGHLSSTQAALIVPLPGSSRYFYVFTTDAFFEDDLANGFRYSVVDMCLDGGMGDVIGSQKNTKLLDSVSEKLTAVKHSNGRDYWIIVHKFYSTVFYAYELTPSGLGLTVFSDIGSPHPVGSGSTWGAIGQMKASPNGHKIAVVSGNAPGNIAEYFDFNNQNGTLSNWVDLQLPRNYNYYGVSFSPDNSKLYVSSEIGLGVGEASILYQYNLSAGNGNPDSVRASQFFWDNYNLHYWALQLAPDGKIYVARTTALSEGEGFVLGVINNPNLANWSCNFIDMGLPLNTACSYGLPNFIDSYNYSNGIDSCYANPCPTSVNVNVNGDTLSVYNAVSQQWYLNGNPITNATSSTYIAHQGGSYTVMITDSNGCTATSTAVIISGIDNLSEEDAVSVWLTAGGWEITVGNNFIGSTAEIFDANGRLVFQSEIRNHKSEIDPAVAKGVYLLRISSARSSVVRKLVRL